MHDGTSTGSILIASLKLGVRIAVVLGAAASFAQAPSPPEAKPAEPMMPEGGALAPLAWLEGCWRGTVNQREYREHWMPLRGSLIVGVSHTVARDKTQGFEYLRLESRPDGVYYVASPSGKTESAFRLTERTIDRTNERNDQVFTFVNPALDFPQKITYRRASEGWLYADVEGKAGSAERKVTYPMRRTDCESGELIFR
jgi:hypothetical protein